MFNCKQNRKVNHISDRTSHDKNMVVNIAVQSECCIMLISKNIQKY